MPAPDIGVDIICYYFNHLQFCSFAVITAKLQVVKYKFDVPTVVFLSDTHSLFNNRKYDQIL